MKVTRGMCLKITPNVGPKMGEMAQNHQGEGGTMILCCSTGPKFQDRQNGNSEPLEGWVGVPLALRLLWLRLQLLLPSAVLWNPLMGGYE